MLSWINIQSTQRENLDSYYHYMKNNNNRILCIYALVLNGKRYIGSSVDVHKRYRSHISGLMNGKHHSYKLQREFDKMLATALPFEVELEILFECNPEDIESIERLYMKGYKSIKYGYNVTGSTKRTAGNAVKVS